MPRALKELRIAAGHTSTVFDYRSETPSNGGIIELRACVHHIPVIRNVEGREDLDTLRRVLMAQGLMVQFGDDAEGNVAMYTKANRLCYHARGGNSVTCGIEHMHYTVGEPWTERQMRAAAWIAQYLEREFDIPLQMANVEPGPGATVTIVRKGHTSHQQISRVAGFNDRSDPGRGFDYGKMFHNARYFKAHGHFIGA
jgi:predicted Rdx family selenoprotein